MNQEQFADCLGTTVLSINRWENGKTEPNKMAQKQLYQFCKDNDVDLAKMIIESKSIQIGVNPFILDTLKIICADLEKRNHYSGALYFYRLLYDLTKDNMVLGKINSIQNRI